MKQVPVNIKVKFGSAIVKLENHESHATTKEGVEIWLKMRPANEVQPMATIPDGTLEKYKHCRPKIISCDWKAA
jgi:hypothetical protein